MTNRKIMRDLAWFRYDLRRFLRFSENAARQCRITPQQHQLMLALAGFKEGGTATISELAEFLQERNNSVVGLVKRAAANGLVTRRPGDTDRRRVVVSLTPKGEMTLERLTDMHHEEIRRIRLGYLKGWDWPRGGAQPGKSA